MSLSRVCGWGYGHITFVIQISNFLIIIRITCTSIEFAFLTGNYLCRFTGRTPRRLFVPRQFRTNFPRSHMERIYGRRYWAMLCVRTSFFKSRKWSLMCIVELISIIQSPMQQMPPLPPPPTTSPSIRNITITCEPTSMSINI